MIQHQKSNLCGKGTLMLDIKIKLNKLLVIRKRLSNIRNVNFSRKNKI